MKILAHRVVRGGVIHGLSVVRADNTGVDVKPFEAETAATAFVDGTVVVEGGALYHTTRIISALPLPAGLELRKIWPQD